MAKVIIFGLQDFAELAHYYLRTDSPHEVVAFCVHEAWLPETQLYKELPVVAFEKVEGIYPPSDYVFFAPMAPKKMNTIRQQVYESILQKGYQMISYISSRATVLNEGAIGDNCFILEDSVIQPFVKVGNNVILWSMSVVSHHSIIEDHSMLAPGAVVAGNCTIGANVFIGANATICDGVKIARGSLIGMGSSIRENSSDWSVYISTKPIFIPDKDSKYYY